MLKVRNDYKLTTLLNCFPSLVTTRLGFKVSGTGYNVRLVTVAYCALVDNKQLMDEVFVISRIIKVSVRVISLSLRLRLITPTSTLIILDITKTESNNCFIIH